MTNRNRRGRSGGPKRRSGRNVWVNNDFTSNPVGDALAIVNLLQGAESFMTFDTTIVEVVIPVMNYSVLTDATVANRGVRCALMVAQENLDASDMISLFTDSVGPPWLWTGGDEFRTGAAGQLNLSLVIANGGTIRAKAKRRFRENDATLFLIVDNESEAGDSQQILRGFARILIHIP